MFLLILAAIVSGDVVKINTVNTGKPIQLLMGGAPQTFTVDAYGRMTWMDNPSTREITLLIGDDSYDLRTSATGAGYNGCNYNFDFFSDVEMYQNSGMECTKVFEKAPGAIELINDVGKSVYPAFDLGWGFSSDSVLGWLGADMIAVYTSQNPYLAAIGAKEGTELEVGYFDQSNYKSCGKVKVGEEFIKQLSECTGEETKVGVQTHPHKVMTGKYQDNFEDGGKCNGDGTYTWSGKMSYQGCDLACLKSHCSSLGRETSYGDYTIRQGKIFACCRAAAEESVGAILYGDTSGTDGGEGRTEMKWGAKTAAHYNSMSSADKEWVDEHCGEGILEEERRKVGRKLSFTDCRYNALQDSGTFVWYDGDCYLYEGHHPHLNVKYKHHRPQGQKEWIYCTTKRVADSLAFAAPKSTSSTGTISVLHVFAAVGLAITCYGAFRHYTKN